MSYQKKAKGWRTLVIENQQIRWRFVIKEEYSLLKLQGDNSSHRQAIVILRSWRDPWLNFGQNIPPNEPAIITTKFASQAAEFTLQNGWDFNQSGPPVYFEYRQGDFFPLNITAFTTLKKKFLEVFATQMQELGFDRKEAGSYYKLTDTGKVGINLTTEKSGDMLRVELAGFIRIDKLEDVLCDFQISVLNEKRVNDSSFAGNIGIICDGAFRIWQVFNESEISEIEEMVEIIKRTVLPYFEKYTDPQQALEALNDTKTGWKLDPFIERRMGKALILTYVLDNYDLFIKQASEGENAIMKYPYKPESRIIFFLQLRDWLDKKFAVI